MLANSLFESTTYYLIMPVIGWLLVTAQIVIAIWLYKELRGEQK